jgi:hypothetical protein
MRSPLMQFANHITTIVSYRMVKNEVTILTTVMIVHDTKNDEDELIAQIDMIHYLHHSNKKLQKGLMLTRYWTTNPCKSARCGLSLENSVFLGKLYRILVEHDLNACICSSLRGNQA